MASVHEQAQGKSPFWYCRYVTAGGQQRMKSTGIRIKDDPKKKRANLVCQGWQDAENALSSGDISHDRILELYNDTLKRAGLKVIDSPTVGRWMKDWLEGKRKIAESTRIAYEQAVRDFLEFLGPAGAHRKLENITEKDIDAFVYNELQKAEELRVELQRIQSKYLLDLAEVVVAVNDERGKIKLHRAGDLTNRSAVYGGGGSSLANLILTNSVGVVL